MFLQVISVDCVTVVCAWRCCGVPVWKCCVCACVRSVPCGVLYVACAGPRTNFLPPEPILQNSLTTSSSSNPYDPSKPSHSSPPPEARNENFKNPRVATLSKCKCTHLLDSARAAQEGPSNSAQRPSRFPVHTLGSQLHLFQHFEQELRPLRTTCHSEMSTAMKVKRKGFPHVVGTQCVDSQLTRNPNAKASFRITEQTRCGCTYTGRGA